MACDQDLLGRFMANSHNDPSSALSLPSQAIAAATAVSHDTNGHAEMSNTTAATSASMLGISLNDDGAGRTAQHAQVHSATAPSISTPDAAVSSKAHGGPCLHLRMSPVDDHCGRNACLHVCCELYFRDERLVGQLPPRLSPTLPAIFSRAAPVTTDNGTVVPFTGGGAGIPPATPLTALIASVHGAGTTNTGHSDGKSGVAKDSAVAAEHSVQKAPAPSFTSNE